MEYFWLTVEQAAQACGVTRDAIRKAAQSGKLPATKSGKIWQIDPAGLSRLGFRSANGSRKLARLGVQLVDVASTPEPGSVDDLIALLTLARAGSEGAPLRLSQSTSGGAWRLSPVIPADDLYIEVVPGLVSRASLKDDSG